MKKPNDWDYRGRPDEYRKAMKEYESYERKKFVKAVLGIGGAVIGGIRAVTQKQHVEPTRALLYY